MPPGSTPPATPAWDPNAGNPTYHINRAGDYLLLGRQFNTIGNEPMQFLAWFEAGDAEPPTDPTLSSSSHLPIRGRTTRRSISSSIRMPPMQVREWPVTQ